MIVRFDTEKEARDRFEELRQKYAHKIDEKCNYPDKFYCPCKDPHERAQVIVTYKLKKDQISVSVAGLIKSIQLAMKIVDLMVEV